MFSRRNFLANSAASAVMLTTPSLVRAAQKTVVTISQGNPTYQALLSELTTQFENDNPSMAIKFIADGDNWDPLLNSTIRGSLVNSLPDASWQALTYADILAKRNIAQPLNKYFGNDTATLEASGISKAMIDATSVNNEVFAMPFGTTIPVVYCNMDLLRKAGYTKHQPPASWAEMQEIGLKVKALGDGNSGGFIEYNASNAWMFQTLVSSYGGAMMNPARTEIAFDNATGLKALTALAQFGETIATDMSTEQARQAFKAGKTAMHIQSASGTTAHSKAINGQFELAVGQVPIEANGRMVGAGHGFFMFTKDPAKQEIVWEFMKFASGKKGQLILAKNTGYMPVNLVALKDTFFLDEYLKINPLHRNIVERLAVTGEQISFPGENTVKIGKMMSDEMRGLLFQKGKPDEVLAKIASRTRELLA